MKKTIAAVLTAMAMVVALVLPMTAFADDKAPTPAKKYEEEYKATRGEPDYDVIVDAFEEEDAEAGEETEDASVVVDVDTDVDVDLPSVAVKGLKVDLSDGEYDIDYTVSGTGTMKLVEPAKLVVKGGQAFARLAWNDPEVDRLVLNGVDYLPVDFTKSHNIQGKLPVFLLPLSQFGKDLDFNIHTRGVNLEIDDYTLNMKKYDPDFDATALKAKVQEDISGAQPVKFYKWRTGMKSSIWGPFAFLAAVALAIFGWSKAHKRDE